MPSQVRGRYWGMEFSLTNHAARAAGNGFLAGHSVRAIENALCPLADYISCLECKQALADRVKQVVVQWSMVRVRGVLFGCVSKRHTDAFHLAFRQRSFDHDPPG